MPSLKITTDESKVESYWQQKNWNKNTVYFFEFIVILPVLKSLLSGVHRQYAK